MKQLEDKIKDRLEGFESSLPEGDLAEFRTLLDDAAGAGMKRKAACFAWMAPVAIAAGLALFFILRPTLEIGSNQVTDNGIMVAQAVDPVTVEENTDVDAVESSPDVAHKVQQYHSRTVKKEEHRDYTESENITEETSVEAATPEADSKDSKTVSETPANNGGSSPFVPSTIGNNKKAVSIKVGPAAAGVLGGSGAIALASLLPSMLNTNVTLNTPQSSPVVGPGGTVIEPGPDERTGDNTHHMPLRAGLSIRIPFNERWSLTTGVDYSWYSSTIGYSVTGGHKQDAHYIGIPVRADFTIARNRWLDVYVGAGASADFCVAAYDAGKKIAKDGVGFSLIGAGGVQFNFTDNFGLFLDPTFSWNIPSNNRVLDTYRYDHPFMFSVSTGLRITVPTRK